MEVHPLFDINEQVWVTDDGLIANTLRELQTKLPPEAVIVGYHPDGCVVNRSEWPTDGKPRALRAKVVSVHTLPTAVRAAEVFRRLAEKQREEQKQKEREAKQQAKIEAKQQQTDERAKLLALPRQEMTREQRRDTALNMRAANTPTSVISQALGLSVAIINREFRQARKAGDSRAVVVKVRKVTPKPLLPRQQWTPERDAELARLAATGCTASDIAEMLGDVSRNSVIGRCHRKGIKIGR